MNEVGITKRDYFIYNDDSEHSYRLSKVGKIICIPSIEIIHDGPQVLTKDGVNWKLYYSIRNVLNMIKSNWPKRYYVTYKIYVRIKYFLIIDLTVHLYIHVDRFRACMKICLHKCTKGAPMSEQK